MKFVIEHLEDEISEWVIAEYTKISETVGKDNLIFTNVIKKGDYTTLSSLGEVRKESVLNIEFKNSCLLDPQAKKTLNPKDKFDYFIFGGILGDNPPRRRTQKLCELSCEKRNLGDIQMSTDTAVEVVSIISKGTELKNIKFIDEPEIQTRKNESVILPYRYLNHNEEPKMSKKIREMLEKDDVF